MNIRAEQIARRLLPYAFGLFVAITILLIFVHEPWADEAQAWLLARDSSLGQLLWYSAGYEGTPMLWHILLMPFAKLGLPYVSMHILNAVLIVTAAGVFVWKSPFTSLQRLLFLFGYFPLYEYNALSRSYVLSMLFLFVFAAVYRYRIERPVLVVLPLALLLQTNTHSIPLAGMLFLYVVYDVWKYHRVSVGKKHVLAVTLFIASCIVAVVQLWTPSDLLGAIAVWEFSFTLQKISWVSSVFGFICFPVPLFTMDFWDELNPLHADKAMVFIGAAGFAMTWIFLAPYRRLLIAYLVAAFGMCAIFFFRIPPHTRHAGVLMSMFLVCIWLSRLYEHSRLPTAAANRLLRIQNLLLVLFFFFHAVVGVNGVIGDIRYDFAQSERLSQFIRDGGYTSDTTVIIAYPCSDAAAALPYIPDLFKTMYSIEGQRDISFTTWNNALFDESFGTDTLNERMQMIAERFSGKRILFVLGDAVRSTVVIDPAHFTLLARFAPSVQFVNNYTVYEYHL